MTIREQGETVMSKSMFFLTEWYSEKHHAKLTMEHPMEKICADSTVLSWKLISKLLPLRVTDWLKRMIMSMMYGKMM